MSGTLILFSVRTNSHKFASLVSGAAGIQTKGLSDSNVYLLFLPFPYWPPIVIANLEALMLLTIWAGWAL